MALEVGDQLEINIIKILILEDPQGSAGRRALGSVNAAGKAR